MVTKVIVEMVFRTLQKRAITVRITLIIHFVVLSVRTTLLFVRVSVLIIIVLYLIWRIQPKNVEIIMIDDINVNMIQKM